MSPTRLVASYRDQDGQPRQRTIASLGAHPSVEAKIEALASERERRIIRRDQLARDPRRGPVLALAERALSRLDAEIARLEQIAAELRR